ncbi:hypothetical protein LCGC14_2662130, partial [marine sediment metagenome]
PTYTPDQVLTVKHIDVDPRSVVCVIYGSLIAYRPSGLSRTQTP